MGQMPLQVDWLLPRKRCRGQPRSLEVGGPGPGWGSGQVGLSSAQGLLLCDVASHLPSLNSLFPPEGPSQLCCAGEKPSELGWHMALVAHSGLRTRWPSLGEGEAGVPPRDEDILLRHRKCTLPLGPSKPPGGWSRRRRGDFGARAVKTGSGPVGFRGIWSWHRDWEALQECRVEDG